MASQRKLRSKKGRISQIGAKQKDLPSESAPRAVISRKETEKDEKNVAPLWPNVPGSNQKSGAPRENKKTIRGGPGERSEKPLNEASELPRRIRDSFIQQSRRR